MNKRDGPLLQKVLRTSRNKRRKKMNEIIKNIEAAQLKAEAPNVFRFLKEQFSRNRAEATVKLSQ